MFKEDMTRSIGSVFVNNGHKKSILADDYVMYIKRYSEELAFYIKCFDMRDRNQGISVEMIFTMIGTPDDSLFASGVGIHMQILTVSGEVSDDIMIRAGEKIIAVEDSLGGFEDFVLSEFDNAYFHSKRLAIYKRGFLIYKIVKEDGQLKRELHSLRQDVCKLIKGRKTRQAYQRSHDFMEWLPSNYFEDKELGQITDLDISTFAEYIYAQCVLDA